MPDNNSKLNTKKYRDIFQCKTQNSKLSREARSSSARQLKNKKLAITDTQKKQKTQKLSVSADSAVSSVITMDVYDIKGQAVEKINLPKEIFGAKVNNQLMAQAVRIYLANRRRGTASTKTRGKVTGSTRKIYRQKGTGRARHGSVRAPIFVHGGIVFGPTPRDFSLHFPKKMKRAALFSALSSKVKGGEIKIVTGLEKIEPKTKSMINVINNLNLNTKNKKILLILSDIKHELGENIIRSARNIEGVNFILANNINTYDVLNNKSLIFMKESIPFIEKTFVKGE